mmetsp:Transcript_82016/g.187698  ORF Transcript_82016/g.187698 Transcript_82016/m.187698 type:complete len:123 (+) Transcript_82016:25-393(+)
MGASGSTSEKELSNVTTTMKTRAAFPFSQIAAYAGVAQCDPTVLEYKMAELSAGTADEFLDRCPPSKLELPEEWVDWAKVLLEQIPGLSDMRFRLVPQRVVEDQFWQRYFTRVLQLAQEQVA